MGFIILLPPNLPTRHYDYTVHFRHRNKGKGWTERFMMVICLFIALFIVSLNVSSMCSAKQIIVPAARSDLSPKDVVLSTLIQYHKPCELSFHSPLSILSLEGRLSFCIESLIPRFFRYHPFPGKPLYKSIPLQKTESCLMVMAG